MLQSLCAGEFDQIFSLMERSFPEDEYRPRMAQRALLARSEDRLYGYRIGERLVALAAVWELGDITFLEHLAVDPNCRGGGLGTSALKELLERYDGRLCLEVELPETDLAARRIGFYRRNGFFLNQHPYIQPALGPGRKPVPLRIMTSGGPINAAHFEKLQKLLYETVYARK